MKKYYVVLAEDDRIGASSDGFDMGEGTIEAMMPDEFNPEFQQNWRVVDGGGVYDPLPEVPPEPTEIEKVEARTAALEDEAMVTMLALADVYEMIAGGL